MDCPTTADRVAAYLDGELARSELELFEQHLDACAGCRGLVERVAAVDLTPPPPLAQVAEPRFWGRMDEALAMEHTRSSVAASSAASSAGKRRGPWTWELRVSLPVVLAYAAFLLLAVGWSVSNLRRAQVAEDSLTQMEEMVQREQRQNQTPPQGVVREDATRVVVSTRGTF